jgi:hypothetical protein
MNSTKSKSSAAPPVREQSAGGSVRRWKDALRRFADFFKPKQAVTRTPENLEEPLNESYRDSIRRKLAWQPPKRLVADIKSISAATLRSISRAMFFSNGRARLEVLSPWIGGTVRREIGQRLMPVTLVATGKTRSEWRSSRSASQSSKAGLRREFHGRSTGCSTMKSWTKRGCFGQSN